MKHRYFIAAVLLFVAGLQSGFAQKLILHISGQEKIKYNVSDLESITFEEAGQGPVLLNGHEFVDLGLPSGTLWATMNIGADNPEDFGDYFAWGETQTKVYFEWNTYSLAAYSEKRLLKYCTVASFGNDGFTDNLTELLEDDDVATANWGEKCQTPCKEQLEELMDTTYVNRVIVKNGTVRIMQITSKLNGNSISLPYAGYTQDKTVQMKGSSGRYWSRSLHERAPSSAYLMTLSVTTPILRWQPRYIGMTVRPVGRLAVPYRWLVKDISLNYTQLDLAKGTTELIQATLSPSYATNTEYTAESSNEAVATVSSTGLVTAIAEGTCVITFRTTDGSDLSATCQINVTNQGSTDGHEWVDLGLPSGTIWATCNVGADSPTEYGNYYAWGETQPKEVYTWETYKYCDGTYQTQTKYNDEDGMTWLQSIDDAASSNWGSKWQTPSKEQVEELLNENYTTIEKTTVGGVSGRIIKSKFNNKSVFFPNAGYYSSSGYTNEGSSGHYWARTLDNEYPWFSSCLLSQSSNIISTTGYRYPGKSIRPVRSQKIIYLSNITLNNSELCLSQNTSEQLIATVSPDNAANPNVVWISSNPSIASVTSNGLVTAGTTGGTCIITCRAADGSGTSAMCQVTVLGDFCPNNSHPHVIDLGLPSGTKWSCCNVGATTPAGYGGYYSWGETSAKDDYSRDNYNLDITTDIAGTTNDVARMKMGAPWQMPTLEQMNELIRNCVYVWTTLNGINGVVFTGPNGKQIFLPAAGSYLNTNSSYVGSQGYYWISTPYDSSGYANHMRVSDNLFPVVSFERCYKGLTVRAVRQ